jgi:small multidrug resistance pump
VSPRVLLAGAIVSEVIGTLSLKAALDAPVMYLLVAAGYVASFLLLAAVLRRGMPLGLAYGLWAALGVAVTAVAAALLFGERLTVLTVAGLAVIMVGVLLVETGSLASAEHVPERSVP